MRNQTISINTLVLTPEELFDLTQKKGKVQAYTIYHKEADEVTEEDIADELFGIGGATYYKAAKKAGTEEICFTHSPVKYHRTKEQFILAPTHDEHPCKAAYIVVL